MFSSYRCSRSKLSHAVLVTGYGWRNKRKFWRVKNRSVLCGDVRLDSYPFVTLQYVNGYIVVAQTDCIQNNLFED